MIQGIVGIADVDGVYWTLMYELIFYILMFSLLISGYIKHVAYVVAIGVMLNILNSFVDYIPWKVQMFLLLQYNHLFGAGIIFYLMRRDGDKFLYYIVLFLCILAQWFHGSVVVNMIVTSFFALFLLFSYEKLTFIAAKPLVWLGSISYSLYLLHQNIGYVIIRETEAIGIPPNLAIVLAIICSLLLAHFAVKFIERPSQSWIKKRFQ